MLQKIAILIFVSLLAVTPPMDEATRRLSHDTLEELIDINTTDSVGSTTTAANAMAKHLLDAGFPRPDVRVLGPNDRKGNLVARIHSGGNASLKPILMIGHLDVVEARRADWSTDPFRLVERDGWFYGRGTQDMKSCDVALIITFIRL
jgi:acetylornithine deacetylase/succinyl-diaminopimelate desuccinylase-like protein